MPNLLSNDELAQYVFSWSSRWGEENKRRNGTIYYKIEDINQVDAIKELIGTLKTEYGYSRSDYSRVKIEVIKTLAPKELAASTKKGEKWENIATSHWIVAFNAIFPIYQPSEYVPEPQSDLPKVVPRQTEAKEGRKIIATNPDGSVVIERPQLSKDLGEDFKSTSVIDHSIDLLAGLEDDNE